MLTEENKMDASKRATYKQQMEERRELQKKRRAEEEAARLK